MANDVGTCDTTEKLPVDYTFTGTDRLGRDVPASVDGKLTAVVISGDPAASAMVSDDEPLRVWFVSGDVAGDVVFKVSADADLGGGFKEIFTTFTLKVASPMVEASTFNAVIGAPVPK